MLQRFGQDRRDGFFPLNRALTDLLQYVSVRSASTGHQGHGALEYLIPEWFGRAITLEQSGKTRRR